MNAWQIWHCIMVVFVFVFLLIPNWRDRNKYPEGQSCLCGWCYVVIGVVCGTLSFYSMHLADKQGKTPLTPSEYELGQWSAISSLIAAGATVLVWSVHGSGKCPAFLADWHVGRLFCVVVS